MDDTQIKRVWSKAKQYASTHGRYHDAEDFAQYAALKIAHGRKASMFCLLTDYLRTTYGRTSRRNFTTTLYYSHVDSFLKGANDPTSSIIGKLHFDDLVSKLPKRSRLIFIMYYRLEMTLKEIGITFGLCEARVSQLLSKGNKILKDFDSSLNLEV